MCADHEMRKIQTPNGLKEASPRISNLVVNNNCRGAWRKALSDF